jgi:hypothetical protein
MPAQLNPALVKPLRLNFAQVCIWCGQRWCESPSCIERHDESAWQVCPDCDGATDGLCDCYAGVVEAMTPRIAAAFAAVEAARLVAA